MEVGDLEAYWMGQWSHLGCFKIITGNMSCSCQRLNRAPLSPVNPCQSLGSPESRLREGDLGVRSLLGGVLLFATCWESERCRIQAVIQSWQDLNQPQFWSWGWPLEFTGGWASWELDFYTFFLPPTPPVIGSWLLSGRGSWPRAKWLFSAQGIAQKGRQLRAVSRQLSLPAAGEFFRPYGGSEWHGPESPIE